ncbi:MAG: pyruvate dehydrogenase complex dihydrolipoamide acetyltransferase [Alphaproteobacteria bacterium RIFCSPLOWO2_01_FULL_45_8]|nr:MAG: pyruvate dehydrogenase complex dihydrolipoamide acetyltransferase [Alphaproteobacteria bacterium GWB1_45_5]OFW90029.1 MAG: pyruvate dehydrogenase complex dihydrolipoamide acetyltransferase [Alphaproteobacteria bacterium RIFCSPHIGHO2_01_FULL_41_14]OFW96686.1 MAG: pyruvate dehydrogenase complex dihydrolipoamide acetyltransferase [Alphaproteobacteria bacterium RIFCSPLOWO2_01_FULL_45_8]HCI49195.1 pyruvate dehydrogenase complex dihydrolipoamide acetyltransferase [Holosporales bacterium]
MPIEILMPALSPTMTEGNLVKWHKKEGDKVSAGDVVAEIETDKATMEVEAVDEGTLGKILIPEGTENVKVNSPIALILEKGEDKKVLENYKAPTPAAAQKEEPVSAPVPTMASPAPTIVLSTGRIVASPLAKRLATEKNIDLRQVQGSGPHGRIVKQDIDTFVPGSAARGHALPTHTGPLYQDKPVSNMRRVIAQRLTESKQTVPHFYLTLDCEIDALLAARQSINSHFNVKVTVNDFVLKAVALALQDVPDANASWRGETIRYYTTSDISVAVAIEDGLITPIVKMANFKSLLTISEEVKTLVQKAKEGRLKPEEFQGGSFSVSNLGMFGIKQFEAIINPPQGCILAVGAGEKRPVVKEGGLAVATVMTCSLSVDHRVVDGSVGSKLLQAFKKYIENPALLLVGGA